MQRNKTPSFDQPVLVFCPTSCQHTAHTHCRTATLSSLAHSALEAHHASSPPVFLHQCTLQVGYKIPWTAISSLLHQFNQQFQQPKVLLWLNLAYFLPSMPALLLHSSLQDVLERKLGAPNAALARQVNRTTRTRLTAAGIA
jgi:hypothetical protein